MKQNRSILIVDDEFGVRESLKMILKPIYSVHTAADGKEALQCLQKEKIDLVTLDLKMPGLSGFEVLGEIKKNHPNIEAIVITAYGTGENAMEAIRCGAEFITKPFNVPDLLSSLNKSLEKQSYNLRRKNFSLYNSLVVRN
jgi:DNA-binding NtrC family response regulator